MENNSSNNKATGSLVIFGAPLAVLARNGWEIGLAIIFLFLILYFALPSIKKIRNFLSWLDKLVLGSYLLVILLFILIEQLNMSHSFKALVVLSVGLVSLGPLHKLKHYFEQSK